MDTRSESTELVICPLKLSIMTSAACCSSNPSRSLTLSTNGMIMCLTYSSMVCSLDQCLGDCVMCQSNRKENFGWQCLVFPLYITYIGSSSPRTVPRSTPLSGVCLLTQLSQSA